MDTIPDFLNVHGDGYQMGSAARALLESLKEKKVLLDPVPSNGMLVCATQAQLGFGSRVILREGAVMQRLADMKVPHCPILLGLHLWVSPHKAKDGTPTPAGSIYMEPIEDPTGDLVRLEVQQVAGVRWLRAVSSRHQRRWLAETPVIYMAS